MKRKPVNSLPSLGVLSELLSGGLACQLEAELCRRSLYEFAVAAWQVLEPANDFIDNWHIKVICEHLQAVSEGKIRRLIINIPPRFMKSLLVSVIWPAWEWTWKPSTRWLTASYAQSLAERDAVKMRNLIDSTWYQERFGDKFKFAADQNAKSRFENDATGFRVSTSPEGVGTGEGGDRLIVDDPHNVKGVESDTKLASTIQWWDETMSTRYNNPKTGTAVIVMQRLKENDLTGHLIAKGGWQHLCIPMEYDGVRRSTVLGEYDPRTEEGELLWEERFDKMSVEVLKVELGQYGSACQLQQTPSPRGGGILKRAAFNFYRELPAKFDEIVVSADCTFKATNESDFVSIQAWGVIGPNKYLLPYRVNARLGFTATCTALEGVVALYSERIAILIEDKANGTAVIETLQAKFSGIIAINPDGGKESRAYAMQPELDGGNIWVPHPDLDPTIETFLHQCTSFPNGAHDDEVDAMTQAINWIRVRHKTSGLFDYYARLAAQKKLREQQLVAQ
jgi:predicted phage terminase large subunit-like protein